VPPSHLKAPAAWRIHITVTVKASPGTLRDPGEHHAQGCRKR
jgi:hypothetical protein